MFGGSEGSFAFNLNNIINQVRVEIMRDEACANALGFMQGGFYAGLSLERLAKVAVSTGRRNTLIFELMMEKF